MIIELSCVILSLKTTSCQYGNYSVTQQQLPLQWDGRANARSDYQGGHLVSGTYTQDTKMMTPMGQSSLLYIAICFMDMAGRRVNLKMTYLLLKPRYIVVDGLVICIQ